VEGIDGTSTTPDPVLAAAACLRSTAAAPTNRMVLNDDRQTALLSRAHLPHRGSVKDQPSSTCLQWAPGAAAGLQRGAQVAEAAPRDDIFRVLGGRGGFGGPAPSATE
jgi:hypothetical protein